MPTSADPRPCRVKLRPGGTIKFVAAHHRDVQKAVLAAERAGGETVTIAGITLEIAAISIILPYRNRRRDPLARPYPKENRP